MSSYYRVCDLCGWPTPGGVHDLDCPDLGSGVVTVAHPVAPAKHRAEVSRLTQERDEARAELEKIHNGMCVCVWAPEGPDGESGYIPEPRPFCPQHGEAAEAGGWLAWWKSQHERLALAVDIDPDDPFPPYEAVDEALRRLADLARYRQAVEAADVWRASLPPEMVLNDYERTFRDVLDALFAPSDALPKES